MQQHSGEHIFSGIVHQLFGYENIGFHLGEDTITLDFSGPLTWEDLKTVETKANEIVYRNERIEISYPSPKQLAQMEFRSKKELEGLVRIVTIPDADVCACCGTHVRYTGEIGLIKVLSTANRKDGTRCEIVCGSRALAYVQAVTDQNLAISHRLSAKVFETADAVERLQKEMLDSSYRLRGIILHQLEEKLTAIPEGTPLYTVYTTEGIDTQELRKFLNRVLEEKQAGIAAGFTANATGYQYVIVSSAADLKPLSKLLNETFHGQGGGKPAMIQGFLTASETELESCLQNWVKEKAE
jgi:alanyl-tRNA synthetase